MLIMMQTEMNADTFIYYI